MADAPPDPGDSRDRLERALRERDLFLRLLELGEQTEVEPFLREALALVVAATGARQGYLEVRSQEATPEMPAYSISDGFSNAEVEDIRKTISSGIIAEALATRQTVVTASAMLDERFQDRGSVRLGKIEAVLCSPIGGDPSFGVVYLQGRDAPGPFHEESRGVAELFARHLAPLADRLIVRAQQERVRDHTRELRESLNLDGIIGRSEAFAAVLREAALVAPLDVNVLLSGETGTGKTQLAYVIHSNGPRAASPFIELSCANLPEQLLESELFGARAGAHSTAARAIQGKVAAAEGGTLFLDEIGDLPLTAQAKLLQLLQSKEYYPLGAARPERANIRLIAATHVDLKEAVADGRFREDLYFRLEVLPIRLPSLAERHADILLLAEHFARTKSDGHSLGRIELGSSASHAILAAEWRGNIRQLEHRIEAAVIRAAGDRSRTIEARHVFPERVVASVESEPAPVVGFQEATREFQRDLVARVLEDTGWNVTEAARRLELARSHLYTLIKGFELSRE